MQLVKKGNVYLIRTANKTFTYKTLKGAKNKLNRLKEENVKQKQTQRQSVVVNINTSKAKPTVRKAIQPQPQQTIRLIPSITPFTALEQFISQARPRSSELLPSQIAQQELLLIKNSINQLREEHLKLVEAESKRPEKFDNLFIHKFTSPTPSEVSDFESVDSGFGSMDIAKEEKPKKINERREETITTENIYGEPFPDTRKGRPRLTYDQVDSKYNRLFEQRQKALEQGIPYTSDATLTGRYFEDLYKADPQRAAMEFQIPEVLPYGFPPGFPQISSRPQRDEEEKD